MSVKFLNLIEHQCGGNIEMFCKAAKLTKKEAIKMRTFVFAENPIAATRAFFALDVGILVRLYAYFKQAGMENVFVATYQKNVISINISDAKTVMLEKGFNPHSYKSWLSGNSFMSEENIEKLNTLCGINALRNSLMEFVLLRVNKMTAKKPVKVVGKTKEDAPAKPARKALEMLRAVVSQQNEREDQEDSDEYFDNDNADGKPAYDPQGVVTRDALIDYFPESLVERCGRALHRDFDHMVKEFGEVHPKFHEFAVSGIAQIMLEYWPESISFAVEEGDTPDLDVLEVSNAQFSLFLRQRNFSIVVHMPNGDISYNVNKDSSHEHRLALALGVFYTFSADDLERMLGRIGFSMDDDVNKLVFDGEQDISLHEHYTATTEHIFGFGAGRDFPEHFTLDDGNAKQKSVPHMLLDGVGRTRGMGMMMTTEHGVDVLELELLSSEYRAFRANAKGDKTTFVMEEASAAQFLDDADCKDFESENDYSNLRKHGITVTDAPEFVTLSFVCDSATQVKVIAFR